MRLMTFVCSAVVSVAVVGIGAAADLPAGTVAPSFSSTPNQASSIISELRLGVASHDPSSPERSVDINGEVLFVKFGRSENPFIDVLIPRLHVGGALNTSGKTSYAYAGLTWTYDITKQLFVEGSLGGAFHNGDTRDFAERYRSSLGCSPLFRESAAIGYRIDDHWSIMATVDHLSNAGLCDQNRGLTNIGAKIGYRF